MGSAKAWHARSRSGRLKVYLLLISSSMKVYLDKPSLVRKLYLMGTRNQRAALGRRELDRRLAKVDVESLVPPRSGWIRAIREALVMNQAQLARRLGISPSAVNQLEHAEPAGGITLGKLQEIASALDCRLVYAVVPNSSLESTIRREARAAAASQLGYVSTTMALERQSVSQESEEDILESIADGLIATGRVWEHNRPFRR